jgi:DNA-binding CsgD family transcriptional regulator
MPDSSDPRDALSPRERDVYGLILEGLTNKAIAGRLHLAQPTVKSHVSRILAKTGSRSRAELIVAGSRAAAPGAAPVAAVAPEAPHGRRWPVLPAIAALVAVFAAALSLTLTRGSTGWTLVIVAVLLVAAAWAMADGRRAAGFAVAAAGLVAGATIYPLSGTNLVAAELAFVLDPSAALIAGVAVTLLLTSLARRRAGRAA